MGSSDSKALKYKYDKRAADAAIAFCEKFLRHVKGSEFAGKPLLLEPWEKKIIGDVFGWKRPDGTRRYRTVFIFIPRKNGKSTLIAAVAAYLLSADGEPGAEVYSAAADRSQAGIVFDTCKQMMESSPALAGRVRIFKAHIVGPMNSIYKVLSADVKTKHGLNAHGVLFDELHAQPNRELWDVLTTSQGSRAQPLVFAITTAGWDRQSICYQVYEHAKAVAANPDLDPTFYPVIFEADEDDDWTDEKVWAKANPNLGVSLSWDYMREAAARAKVMVTEQNRFKRLHLNIWTQQMTKWLPLARWEACHERYDESDMAGGVCYGGLDLGSVSDLSAWVMLFPDEDDVLRVVCRTWCPEARLTDTTNKYRDKYYQWASEGHLLICPGDHMDYGVIRRELLLDAEAYQIVDANVDRLFQAHQLMHELSAEGLTVLPMAMGYFTITPAMRELEHRVMDRRIRHNGNPVLTWAIDNITVKHGDNDTMKPDKASSDGKIDPAVALLMALDRAMRHQQNRLGRSVYDERGLVTV